MAVGLFLSFFSFLLVRYAASRDWRGDICSIRPEAALHLCSVPRPVAVTHANPSAAGENQTEEFSVPRP